MGFGKLINSDSQTVDLWFKDYLLFYLRNNIQVNLLDYFSLRGNMNQNLQNW